MKKLNIILYFWLLSLNYIFNSIILSLEFFLLFNNWGGIDKQESEITLSKNK